MSSSAEVKTHPDPGSLKKRVKETGVASGGSLSCARHCEGLVTVGSHLFSTIIHAVGSIVATVAISQLTN